MDGTAAARMPVAWRIAFFVPLAVAAALLFMSSAEHDLHRRIALTSLANFGVAISLIIQAVHWVTRGKAVILSIFVLIIASAELGFGLHTLLRLI